MIYVFAGLIGFLVGITIIAIASAIGVFDE
jgi:hypothetical protein